jgi:hypothetical protein
VSCILSVTNKPLKVCHAECHCAEFQCAECHNSECHNAECHYAECHYPECYDAECHGAPKPTFLDVISVDVFEAN